MKKLFTLLLAIGTLCSCESDHETGKKYTGSDPWWYSDIYVLGGTRPIEVENYTQITLTPAHNTIKVEILSQGISKAELLPEASGISFNLIPERPSEELKAYDYLYLMDDTQNRFQKVPRYVQTLVIRCEADTPAGTQATLRLSTPYKTSPADLDIRVEEE